MELIAVEYFLNKESIITNESKSGFHSYISDYNEQDNCDYHSIMVHLFKRFIGLWILFSGVYTVWKYT